MAPFNPFYYIAIPFSYLWNLLKENDTKRGQLFSLFIGTILFLLGVWVLWQWNSIPNYYHELFIERLCSKDSFDFKPTSMSFQLEIDNGSGLSNTMGHDPWVSNFNRGYNKMSEKFSFRTYTQLYEKKKESNYFYIKYRPYIVDYSPLIGKDNMTFLNNKLSKAGINNVEFDYLFMVCHRFSKQYADFISYKEIKAIEDNNIDSCRNVKSLILWGANSDYLLNTPCLGGRYPSYFDNRSQYNYVTGYLFAKDGVSDVSFTAHSKTVDRPKILNQILHFFSLRDISQAFYSFKFEDTSITIDELDYTISFKENVKFSNSSVLPEKTTLNSISFSDRPYKDVNYKIGVNFYVEFIESSNVQNIRIILLTALLALPLGMIVKNGWAYVTSVNKPRAKNKQKSRKKSK